jgi:hypothetical protein
MNKIWKRAFMNAFLTALYITAIGFFMYYGTLMKIGRDNVFLAPIAMLMLFVFSATITGFLVVGKPAQLYVDGKKKEALTLFTYTLISFSVFTLLAIILLIAFTR